MQRITTSTRAALAWCALAFLLPAAAWSDAFPRTVLQTLTGSSFVLPDDLEAATDILVVGFTQKAGSNTRPWTERLRQDFNSVNGCAVYSVAVLAGVPPLFRAFAVGSIRSGVPEEQRGRFLIVNHDESAWRALTGYRQPDDPYIVVLDKAGRVLARRNGPFDETSYADAAVAVRAAANRAAAGG